jgi:hypothetical protein
MLTGRPTVPDSPQDPLTELAAMAAMHHELFAEEVNAGFTEEQAMRIVLTVVSAGLGGGQ